MRGNRYLQVLLIGILLLARYNSDAQTQQVIEVAETMEEYIQENHIDDIERMIHKFLESSAFIDYLLEQGHDINTDSVKLKKKDISIGEDLDVYVKHFTEHQNFTLIMVPVDIFPLAIYDTLLFSVLEVSDNWLYKNHFRENLDDPNIKARILSDENHHMLTNHMSQQVLQNKTADIAEVQIILHESYISTHSIMLETDQMAKEEKEELLKNWGFFKKLMTHDINLNVEMNIYIFGHDDMQVVQYTRKGERSFRITPANVFPRHQFITE